MHFALPPKGAQATPYNHSSRGASSLRRRPLQVTAIVAVAFCTFYLFLSFLFGSSDGEVIPAGTPKIVIITIFDEKSMSKEYIEKIKVNREDYAQRHGMVILSSSKLQYSFRRPRKASRALVHGQNLLKNWRNGFLYPLLLSFYDPFRNYEY